MTVGATFGLNSPAPDCQQKKADKERCNALSGLQDSRRSATDHDDMGDCPDKDASHNGLIASGLDVCKLSTKDGDNIGQKVNKRPRAEAVCRPRLSAPACKLGFLGSMAPVPGPPTGSGN